LTQSSDELTFASNQIFKDLSNPPAIRKEDRLIAGLEGRLGASDTYIFNQCRLNLNSWEL
jgi:hypothetical protein